MCAAQAGTYLLLEKLKQSVYRRLFKRVALIHRQQEPAKASQVPLGARSLPSQLAVGACKAATA